MSLKKVLLVDDELPALVNMQYVLTGNPDWQLVGSCYSTALAREFMQKTHVDLILLDIEMPDQNGLDFARELCNLPDAPLIVFITAYDQHAVSAFDVFALDYLLKPFDDERFNLMLQRALQLLHLKQKALNSSAVQDYLQDRAAFEAGKPSPELQQLIIKSIGNTERVNLDEVIWLGTAANYVEIHLRNRVVLHRATITAMETRLPAHQFIRLHRTAIVRCEAIVNLKVHADGSHHVHLSNGDEVRVSESYLKNLKKLFTPS
ncbi:LytR/AlgR family response regulator transcription factor [Undibacterium umbellatum]|uniref:Response regulator transcription factor n=1 Tax=Undibacterium umbellatum TaxID=2762300 RepID=A0ABR6ZC07_9BURK|nr:LytTR family DNA-binding domain-containing protein [Undibacterium umbellatum]MBC3909292.1 response regulator transcription factor [Undibacterium umbellatum]